MEKSDKYAGFGTLLRQNGASEAAQRYTGDGCGESSVTDEPS